MVGKKKIIKTVFFFLPFADMINGFLIRNYEIRGVGSLYHLFVLFIFLLVWAYSSVKLDFFCKIVLFFGGISIWSLLQSLFLGVNLTSIGIERESKIICTLFFLMCINSFIGNKILSVNELYTIIKHQIWIVGGLVFVCDISGIYNSAYTGNVGRMGLYSNMNELTIVLATSLFFMLCELYKTIEIKNVILIMILILDMMLIQSKFAFGLIVVFVLAIVFAILKNTVFKGKLKSSTILYSGFSVFAVLFIAWKLRGFFQRIIISFVNRISFMKTVYGSTGNPLDYLSSGRTTRFSYLFINPLIGYFCNQPVRGLLVLLFGNGFTGDIIYTFEMDPFDILLFNGVIGVGVYLFVNYYIVKKCIKQSNIRNHMYIYIIIVASTVVGHVWLGGVCGIYYAIYCVYAMHINKEKSELL